MGTALALVLAAVMPLLAMPPAQAIPPTRTVFVAEGFVIPAGSGCAFDVVIEQSERLSTVTVTEFGDGRVVFIDQAFPRMTNAETGESIVHHSQFRAIDTYDASTDQVYGESSGTSFWWFFPGDVGPFGVVGEPGALLSLTGRIEATFDLDTGTTTSFELDGRVNADLCVMLSDG